MKGLLIKESFLIWKHGKFMIVLALIYCVMAAIKGGYFFAGFSVVFFSMLPMSIMGMDERSKWDHYAVTMPYSRKEIVLSKYIMTFSGAFASAVLYIIAINLPVAFRFGVERGRLWFILVTVLVAAAIGTIISLIETDVSKVGNFIISLPSIAYIAASLILIALSVIISFRIFENKEL